MSSYVKIHRRLKCKPTIRKADLTRKLDSTRCDLLVNFLPKTPKPFYYDSEGPKGGTKSTAQLKGADCWPESFCPLSILEILSDFENLGLFLKLINLGPKLIFLTKWFQRLRYNL